MGGDGIEIDSGETVVAGPTGHSPLPRSSPSASVGELRATATQKGD